MPITTSITAYLLRVPWDNHEAGLDPEKLAEFQEQALGGQPSARFFVRSRPPRAPSWKRAVTELIDVEIQVATAGADALLLCEVEGKALAVCWGQASRFVLHPDAIVQDFGIKVVLNAVDESGFRAVDSRSFDDNSLLSRVQSSKLTSFVDMEFDASRAVLQGMAGVPRDDGFGTFAFGSDALRLRCRLAPPTLYEKLGEAIDYYGRDDYAQRYHWIDNVRTVRQSDLVDDLDESLVRHLNQGDTENISLAAPRIVDFEHYSGFYYPNQRQRTTEPDLDLHLGRCFDAMETDGEIDVGALRRAQIRALGAGDAEVSRWSVYKCIVADLSYEGHRYVLADGRWFKVSDALVQDIDRELESVEGSRLDLPACEADWTEPAYNAEAAAALPNSLLFDGTRLRVPGAASPIEPCDLLVDGHDFVHVKRRKSSATLSHLFSQGTVSATVFKTFSGLDSQVYEIGRRVDLNAPRLPPAADDFTIDVGRLRVTYAVICKNPDSVLADLPFFSKVNLVNAVRTLRSMGIDITATGIRHDLD